MAAHHRVLMVGDESVILYAPRTLAGEAALKITGEAASDISRQAAYDIRREAAVAWAAPDFAGQLQRALGGRREDVVLLFNEADHTYRKEENIPATDWRQRLEEVFPNFIGRAVMEIYPRAEDRPADSGLHSYLLVGVPETEHLRSLGGALAGAGVSVAGLGLLPVESTGLVETLAEKVFAPSGKKGRWSMLSGQHETGGLRQVIAKDGTLALTRMLKVPTLAEAGAAAWAEAVLAESRATMTYLRRFGYTDEQGLDAMVLCGDGEKPLFREDAIKGARLRGLNLSEALAHLGSGVTGEDDNNFADALHAAWAERKDALKLDVPLPLVTGTHGSRH